MYLDEDSLDKLLAVALRAAGIDLATAFEAQTLGWSDERQLGHARSLGRVILTANMKDFAPLHSRWMAEGRHHAGILIVSNQRTDARLIARKVVRLQALRDPAAMIDATLYLNGRADQPLE